MEKAEITYSWADIGHWLARCDHGTGVIELNKKEFPRLSPLFQDYVFIHEHVHLLADKYNESVTNRITDEIFVSRATSKKDLEARKEFIRNSDPVMFAHVPETYSSARFSGMSIVIAVIILIMIIKIKQL